MPITKPLIRAAGALALLSCFGAAHAQAPQPDPHGGPSEPPRFAPPHDARPDGPPPFPGGPAADVIGDLEKLQHIYAMTGRENEMLNVYQNVVDTSHDPVVRRFARDAIAHLQLRPSNPNQAIATLQTQLKEDIERTNAMPPPDMHSGKAPQ
ncbi:hypothetical protein ACQUFY_25580 (plasmid) [Robbsia andropogonis]|uniref:hypothetical protein n=1 Tax=Robbsia andropogonis TaxID=28092 RepID=UPI003D19DCA0